MDQPQWGGLSGCTFEEAQSWRKIAPEADFVTVNVEVTVALPLIVSALAEAQAGAIANRKAPEMSLEDMKVPAASPNGAPVSYSWDRLQPVVRPDNARRSLLPPGLFRRSAGNYTAYERARIVVLPVPYDSTTARRARARTPARSSRRRRMWSCSMSGWATSVSLGITLPMLAVPTENAEAAIARIERWRRADRRGQVRRDAGRQHTVAVSSARAHARRIDGYQCLRSMRTPTCATST
jgi:hypothetical protein